MTSALITAKDIAARQGFRTVREWILDRIERSIRSGYFRIGWDGEHVGGAPLMAFVDFGRWLVRCECGQHNYADPEELVVFCARCGNGNSGMARPVIFPMVRNEIERVLLKRPVTPHPLAKNTIEAARLAKPLFPLLTRSWYPGQSLADLLEMNSMYGVE